LAESADGSCRQLPSAVNNARVLYGNQNGETVAGRKKIMHMRLMKQNMLAFIRGSKGYKDMSAARFKREVMVASFYEVLRLYRDAVSGRVPHNLITAEEALSHSKITRLLGDKNWEAVLSNDFINEMKIDRQAMKFTFSIETNYYGKTSIRCVVCDGPPGISAELINGQIRNSKVIRLFIVRLKKALAGTKDNYGKAVRYRKLSR
jgi:hypothetical protein